MNVKVTICCMLIAVTVSMDTTLPVLAGKAVDVFSRFGFLNLGVRVLPGRDEGNWIFREPTIDVFQNVSILHDKHSFFKTEFNYKYCKDIQELLRTFFNDFSFESLEEPWRAFVAGWPNKVIARELGIDPAYLYDGYCYTLARASRIRSAAWIRRPGAALDVLHVDSQRLELDNATAVSEFITKYGSHYIRSYATGNSVYQVSVYARDACRAILISHDFVENNVVGQSSTFAVHIGEMKVASDNKTVEGWSRSLQKRDGRPGLLRLREQPALLHRLHTLLGDEAVLRLHFETISPVFQNKEKRHSFQEMIDNFLKLWDINV